MLPNLSGLSLHDVEPTGSKKKKDEKLGPASSKGVKQEGINTFKDKKVNPEKKGPKKAKDAKYQLKDLLWQQANDAFPKRHPVGFDAYPNLQIAYDSGKKNAFRDRWQNFSSGCSATIKIDGESRVQDQAVATEWRDWKNAVEDAAKRPLAPGKTIPEVPMSLEDLAGLMQKLEGTRTDEDRELRSQLSFKDIAGAICRFWWNKHDRTWYGKRIQDVTQADYDADKTFTEAGNIRNDIATRRRKWASKTVSEMLLAGTWDPIGNLPVPPLDLWIVGFDVIPDEVYLAAGVAVPASSSSAASSSAAAVASTKPKMPLMIAPSSAYGFTAAHAGKDGAHVIVDTKVLEAHFYAHEQASIKMSPAEQASILDSFTCWVSSKERTEEKHKETLVALEASHGVYMETLKKFNVDFKDKLKVDVNAVYDYTVGSNSYLWPLRYTPKHWKVLVDAVQANKEAGKLPFFDKELRAILDATLTTMKLDATFPHASLSIMKLFSDLKDVHSLWKLMAYAPRAETDFWVLRSVGNEGDLPHNIGKATSADPAPRSRHMNASFSSTTIAEPAAYSDGMLSGFMDGVCCLQAILIRAGMPILPAYLSNNSAYTDAEEEVIISPLTVLTFVGREVRELPGLTKGLVPVWIYEAESLYA